MDCTFKVIRKPFQLLLTIHLFMSPGKAVPAVLVMMSRRPEYDYVQVKFDADYYLYAVVNDINDDQCFHQGVSKVKQSQPKVSVIILDFENARFFASRILILLYKTVGIEFIPI